jgi:cytochrome P450
MFQVSSTITTFVLLMALYPDVQEKARAELDACVGRNRLPNETDFGRPDMPYITAMIKETHRWAPAAPLGQLGFIACPHHY